VDRRDFLKGAAASLAILGGGHAYAQASAQYQRLLVLVELKGGNDGFNTVVPYADAAYYALRPKLAIARDGVVQLTDRVGLHPALEPLAPAFKAGRLAILQGVGYPAPNLSHFRSIEIWDTAAPSDRYLADGWLTRTFASAATPRAFAADGVVRLVYAGALTPIYELDVALEGLARVVAERPELQIAFDVYGRGDAAEPLAERARADNVEDKVTFHGRIPIEDVPLAVSRADIGVAPTRRDPFTDVSLSTKVFEYAAMGKPVVASRLPMVEHTFPAGTVTQYEPGDASSLAAAIAGIADDPLAREAAVERTARIVAERAWEREAEGYIQLVDRLATDTRRLAATTGGT